MATSFEKQSSNLGHIDIKIDRQVIEPVYNTAIKKVGKTIQIKGFRPGHVPVEIIKKRHGLGILIDETYKIVNEELNKAIETNQLNVVGQALPIETPTEEEFVTAESVDFKFEIGFVPEFEINLEKIQYEIPEIIPSDEAIEDSIEKLRNQFANSTNPEEVEKGDFVFGDLSDEATGFNKYIGVPTDRVKEDQLFKFTGLEKGSSVSIDVKALFENDRDLEMLLGQDAIENILEAYNFKVAEISRQAPAELNQEFFDKAIGEGKATNIEEFKNEVKTVISQNYGRETSSVAAINLENSMIDQANLDINEDFMKRFLKANNPELSEELIDSEFHLFMRRLKLDIINNKIAELYNDDVQVSFDDILESAKNKIRGYFGGSGYGFEGMEDFIDKMARDMFKKGAKDLRNNIDEHSKEAFTKKVFGFVASKGNQTTRLVSIDEFKAIVDEINNQFAKK